jgi:hypothetical protein
MTSREERFWAKVKKEGCPSVYDLTPCWLWNASVHTNGYGKFSAGLGKNGGWENAHRVSYRLTKGEIPEGLVVRHKCDVRLCVNPDHLELGTKSDNAQDMMKRGRNRYINHPKPGETNPMSKLSDAQRSEIRDQLRAGAVRRILAQTYGVCRQTIDNLAKDLL